MKMSSPSQLKALIKNKSKEFGIAANVTLHMYVMERFLDRLSRSDYRERFVLKGGYLLYSKKGMSRRTTEDLDLTSKTLTLENEEILPVIQEICAIDADDVFAMEVIRTTPVAEMLDHPGIRFFIDAKYEKLTERFYIDVVPSLEIVPEEVDHSIMPLFGGVPISIRAYRIETVIAEKLHAMLTRGDENTRMRDYYDFYILEHEHEYDDMAVASATRHIFEERGTVQNLEDWMQILQSVRGSPVMQSLWTRYQQGHVYAGEITFEDTCDSAERLLTMITADTPEEL